MGPRPFGHGNESRTHHLDPRSSSFNGAATFQSRKPARQQSARDVHNSFNGAATFQSRKLETMRTSRRSARSSFNGAATFQSRKLTVIAAYRQPLVASMGPRPFSHGNLWAE